MSAGLLPRFWREEDGANVVEYAILLGFMAVVMIAAVIAFRNAVSQKFQESVDALG